MDSKNIHLHNVWTVYKLQWLSVMHDICNNNINVPFFL